MSERWPKGWRIYLRGEKNRTADTYEALVDETFRNDQAQALESLDYHLFHGKISDKERGVLSQWWGLNKGLLASGDTQVFKHECWRFQQQHPDEDMTPELRKALRVISSNFEVKRK